MAKRLYEGFRDPPPKLKSVVIRVPDWVEEEKLRSDVERLLEEKYGLVSAEALRRKFGISALRTHIEVDEHEVLALREAEKRRLAET